MTHHFQRATAMLRLLPLLGALGVEPNGNQVALFVFFTAILLAGSVLVFRFIRDGALIILGLLVAAAAVGYDLLGVGAVAAQTTTGPVSVSAGLGLHVGL